MLAKSTLQAKMEEASHNEGKTVAICLGTTLRERHRNWSLPIKKAGATLIYLPPYSPDFSPMKMLGQSESIKTNGQPFACCDDEYSS
jgi:hypothetical protein